MPKAKNKFYAVRKGRQGPQIYVSWEETKTNVARYPGAVHKSFTSLSQAQEWLAEALPTNTLAGELSRATMEAMDVDSVPTQTRRVVKSTITSSGRVPTPAPALGNPPNTENTVQLSPEQKAVLELVKEGKNVFFTGSAGTGKSVLLREIIRHCRGDGRLREGLAVTAATGIASVNIGGSTLHSWAGIGLGKEPAEKLLGKLLGQDKYQREKERLRKKKLREQGHEVDDHNDDYDDDDKHVPRVVERWRIVKTLIIDEISMIDGVLFDKLEFIARHLRRSDEPFGGIQLVLSGDFCQLPPVPDRNNNVPQPPTFAFDAECWTECVGRPIVLHRVFRQKDQGFVDMLNAMRFGRLVPETVSKFRKLSRPVMYEDGIEPTDLFPTRREVDNANHHRLSKLSGDPHQYKAADIPGRDENDKPIPLHEMDKLLERLIAPKLLALKVGAQVMLIKNLVQGQLVNGSVGRVVAFHTPRDAIKQGAEIARTEVVDPKLGQKRADKIPEDILRSNNVWPIVQFQNGSELLCIPSPFEVNNADGRVEARRDQVPLILAWALSIHKSQGQTLERVRVNLAKVFEKGQAYVALSRATTMQSLQVLGFDAAKVVAHPRVLEWMSENTGQDYRAPEEIDDDEEYWDYF
ncbi:uncharacterized protein FIBRA_02379 [Fibroporia radiculosa]|uniref:ATP-dependent DNA helicase PIF1 n=1 Tax=Fibroporia radiculosa TaxID=599839 RepID=J4H1T8_9APHY|nr:uncharacterized protein FIBRA_02379 [Fibroporia radiculosa]CCM00349.1 predicted protein [Fibroporia radiculosa]